LAGVWEGHRWSLSRLPHSRGESLIGLDGVACASVTLCIAVGSVESPAGTTTLSEQWDGGRWLRLQTPNPTATAANGKTLASLRGVTCEASTSCTAVGAYDYYADREKAGTLVERWDGTRWMIQTSSDPPDGGALEGVSCLSSTFCMAVGYVQAWDFARALAERWDGLGWSIQPTPKPPISRVLDVSCTSTIACTAVGTLELDIDDYPWTRRLVERWEGNRWSLEKTEIPVGASTVPGLAGSGLSRVSCTSPAVCDAVGWYQNRRGQQTALIEHRDAAGWSAVATPPPPDTTLSLLSGVSCVANAICTAVGEYDDHGGTPHPLVLSTAGPWLTPASAEMVGIGATCAKTLFPRVQGRGISSVRWWLDGRRIAGRVVRHGTEYAASFALTPGTHQLTARVTFVGSSQSAPRTFRETVLGCLPPTTGFG